MTLPTGTVTFWLTDIEGSTRLLRRLGDEYTDLLAEHHAIVRTALRDAGGIEVSTEGDSFFCVFASARAAVGAAAAVQRALAAHTWSPDAEVRVRVGMHTGEGRLGATGYVGIDVHRAARVAAAAHGGQVLLTAPTRALLQGAWPPGVGDVFLGAHRLKDLDSAELIYQLVIEGVPARFPPIRSLEAPAYDLPAAHSELVGRERDMAAVSHLLEGHRLVTLTGPGGVGKTRLAVATAAEVSTRYPGGVAFVPLASVHDPDLVADEVARALVLPPGEYGGEHGLQRLADQVAGRRMLLVLDNLEQLLPGAPRLAALLEALASCTALVTSRAPLRLQVEQEYLLRPLAVPDEDEIPERVVGSPAVRQFLERAHAARPDLTIRPEDVRDIARIVRAVDGLPLAVELVAARLRTLSLRQISQRLGDQLALLRGGSRDLPPRQQTLRETLRWSFELLGADAKQVLPSLAVFPGGATLEALEYVLAELVDSPNVLDSVDELVEHGLLLRSADSSERYRILQVVREFAAELLRHGGAENGVRRRQAEWVVGFVEATAPLLVTDRQAEALSALREEHDNVREALLWATDHDAELGARIGVAVWRFWQMRGHLAEGAAALDRLLARLPATRYPRQRAALQSARGGLAYWQFDIPAMHSAYQEAVELAEVLGDDALLAAALYDLAFPQLQSRRFDDVADLAGRSEEIFAHLGDAQGVARARWMRGLALLHTGDAAGAESLFAEAAARFREVEDSYYLGWALRMLGRAHLEQKHTALARQTLRESLRIFAPAGDTSAVVLHLADFAALAGVEGDAERQVRLVGALRHLQRVTGTHLVDYEVNRVTNLERSLTELGNRASLLLAEGSAMDLDSVITYVLEPD